jgi:hypothetical protein
MRPRHRVGERDITPRDRENRAAKVQPLLCTRVLMSSSSQIEANRRNAVPTPNRAQKKGVRAGMFCGWAGRANPLSTALKTSRDTSYDTASAIPRSAHARAGASASGMKKILADVVCARADPIA